MYSDQSALKGPVGGTRVLFAGQLATPDASKYAIVYDSTNDYPKEFAAPPKAAALPTPGTPRGCLLGKLLALNVSCTGQNVSVVRYGLHGDGSWHEFATDTVTAGAAAKCIVWDPSGYAYADGLVVVLAGGVAPTALYANLLIRDLAWR